jgi:hypothetical protein
MALKGGYLLALLLMSLCTAKRAVTNKHEEMTMEATKREQVIFSVEMMRGFFSLIASASAP